MGFVLLVDRLPYEYSSLPIVLFLIAYWGVSQSCSLRQIGIDCGHWKVLLATILSVFALLYFVKDAKKGWSEVFGYSQAIYADDFENQAINNDRRSPFQQIEISEQLCKKYPGYDVYVDHYRWSPMCLPDQYSGLVWAELLSRTIVIGRISEAKHTAFLNEEGRGIWFYMRP
jgi:hypothetical protein